MDNRERFSDFEESIRAAWDGFRTGVWTMLPGIIQSFEDAPPRVTVQPSIKGLRLQADGSIAPENLPLLKHVPVVYLHGGGCVFTCPIAAGDECMLFFASRAIDGWFQSGKIQLPTDPRMHDFSDAVALVGVFSKAAAAALGAISTTTAQLRSLNGATFVELDPAGQIVNIVAPGGINLTGPVAITGALTVSETIVAQQNISSATDVLAAGKSGKTHEHSGVQSGGGTSGPPV